MHRRLKLLLAIAVLVFALGLCGGVPSNQSSQKTSLESQTTLMAGMYAYDLFQHLFVSSH
jgi:hypothetical protein